VVTEKLCVLLFPLNIPKKPQKYYKNQYKPLNNPKITQSDSKNKNKPNLKNKNQTRSTYLIMFRGKIIIIKFFLSNENL
jgi:hypothetical protein